MTTKYFFDIEQMSLSKYRRILENSQLLPGRKILAEKTKERLELLEQRGISNLFLLVQALKTSEKIRKLSEETNIPIEYLTILRRELNRLLPKPVSLAAFPGIEKSLIEKLSQKGIMNTLNLFEKCDTKKKRKAFAKENEIAISDLEELTKLSDLSRIWGVGPVFCRIFYESGTDTILKVADESAQNLFDKLIEINDVKKYTKAKFTKKDIVLCIETARDLPKTIEI